MSSWLKKPVNIGITIGAAVLAVVAIGLIVWGVTHHTEGGLLCVRWHNGQAIYLNHEECDESRQGAEELEWPREEVPFTVLRVDESENHSSAAQADRVIAQIVRDTNVQVGCELARVVDVEPRSGVDIWFHWGAAYESGSEASACSCRGTPEFTEHRGYGAPVSAHVTMRGGLSDRAAYLAGLHGFLHGVGLAHDDDHHGSIMYPLTPENPDMGPLRGGRITDHDVTLLRRLYCGGR